LRRALTCVIASAQHRKRRQFHAMATDASNTKHFDQTESCVFDNARGLAFTRTDSVQQQLEHSMDPSRQSGSSVESNGHIDHRQKRKRGEEEEGDGTQKRMKTEGGDKVMDTPGSPVQAQVGVTDVLLWMQQQQRTAPQTARPFFKRLAERYQ
jgi:hypothetical protein